MSSEVEDYLKSVFAKVLVRPQHSLVVTSPNQTSLSTVLDWLAQQLTSARSEITHIEPDGASIKIEQIRPLYRLAHHRREESARRVIVMKRAELMTQPAQNALLKLLEEPPKSVIFLLGTTELKLLTPTIISRSRILELPRVNRVKFDELFPGNDSRAQERRYQLSQGDPILAANMTDLESTIEQAKRFFAQPIGELTEQVSKLNPSREQVQNWCHGLVLICQAALQTSKSTSELKSWLKRSEAVMRAQRLLRANASHKLTLKWLLLEIRQ